MISHSLCWGRERQCPLFFILKTFWTKQLCLYSILEFSYSVLLGVFFFIVQTFPVEILCSPFWSEWNDTRVLVAPTNCRNNNCIAHSSNGNNSTQSLLLSEGYSWLPDQFCLADVDIEFPIDLMGRRFRLTEMTPRNTMQILYPQNHWLHQSRVWGGELFHFLEPAASFYITEEPAEKK